MANKYKGEVGFDAGDESFVLRFSANAVVGLEEAFDMTIGKLGEVMSDPATLRMASIKKMFCIGLVDHYAETRPEIDDAKAQVIYARLAPVEATQLVIKAFMAAFDAGGQAAPTANPPRTLPGQPLNGTGPTS